MAARDPPQRLTGLGKRQCRLDPYVQRAGIDQAAQRLKSRPVYVSGERVDRDPALRRGRWTCQHDGDRPAGGGALVLAIVTAVVDAAGGARLTTPTATLAAYRPALFLITGVAVAGALVALSGLRPGADTAPVVQAVVEEGLLADRADAAGGDRVDHVGAE